MILKFLYDTMSCLLLKTGIFNIFILDITSVGDTNHGICENVVTVVLQVFRFFLAYGVMRYWCTASVKEVCVFSSIYYRQV